MNEQRLSRDSPNANLVTLEMLWAEVERLAKEDEIHWKTRRTLLADIERITKELEKVRWKLDACQRNVNWLEQRAGIRITHGAADETTARRCPKCGSGMLKLKVDDNSPLTPLGRSRVENGVLWTCLCDQPENGERSLA